MKILYAALVLVGCSSSRAPAPDPLATAPGSSSSASAATTALPAAPAAEKLTADTPRTTFAGHGFIAPAEWRTWAKGRATLLEAPEGDSWIALVDAEAKEADAAVAEAWALYKPAARWPLKSNTNVPDGDGWQDQRLYAYQTSPDERRVVFARAMRRNGAWTVVIHDASIPTRDKRIGAFALIFGRLLPKGYARESFAGKKANPLDEARLKQLSDFVERARETLGVPGVSVGIVQGGKTVLAAGFGVRELGKPTKVDADTLYIIASNTKALTTLMLAKLVDEKKLGWDTQVSTLLPPFKLGDEATTSRVQVKHLVCACTGMPRQDMEWLLEFEKGTAATTLASLGKMQPTSKFGEMYQYSNPLAAAAGFVGGFVAFPKKELGAGYDEAMRTRVFEPLGMTSTTFDFTRATRGNYARAHGLDVDGKPAGAVSEINRSIVPMRPAGGAWSNVTDVLKYVSMELAKGELPNGKRYLAESTLLERRAPQVSIGMDSTYGMGLSVSTKYGTPVVQHGGSMIGYKSNMMWLPEHGVGAVILTNSDPGGALTAHFQRKLLELLFDGLPEAETDLTVGAKAMYERIAAERKLLTLPADPAIAGALAARYTSPQLGELRVTRTGAETIFDFGEWKGPVASRKNPDGSVSLITTATGFSGLELVVREAGGKRTLVFRAGQHEYTFTEA